MDIIDIDYETEEIMTDRLILMKGKEKDFLKVYEFDFNSLKDVNGIFNFKKSDNSKIKKCFSRGSKSYYKKCKSAHMFDWIIYEENKPIGNVFTYDEDIAKNSIKLEINIHPNYWGKNYAPEALVSVINYIFKLGITNIICEYLDGNKKAKRILDKLGFKAYYIDKDVMANKDFVDKYVLIMEKEEWLSRTTKIKL